jgi:hypothetical protein
MVRYPLEAKAGRGFERLALYFDDVALPRQRGRELELALYQLRECAAAAVLAVSWS